MKATLIVSIVLNLALMSGLFFVNRYERAPAASRLLSSHKPETSPEISVSGPNAVSRSFGWNQLESTNGYRMYIANLRAAGCPEPTIADIVHGDVTRTFVLMRKQLVLDGSGNGPWSWQEESRLESSLLGLPKAMQSLATARNQNGSFPDQTGQNHDDGRLLENQNQSPSLIASTTVFSSAENQNYNGLISTHGRDVAQSQHRTGENFNNSTGTNPSGNGNPSGGQSGNNPTDSNAKGTGLPHAQEPDPLLISMGSRAYMEYQQQLYNEWFESKMESAKSAGEYLTINPDDFYK